MKNFFIKSLNLNEINYGNAFSNKDDAIEYIGKLFKEKPMVVLANGFVEVYVNELVGCITIEIVKEDLGNYFIADVCSGHLLKAYFENKEKAIDFLYDTYDEVEWDIDNDTYSIKHKNTYIGTFDIVGD